MTKMSAELLVFSCENMIFLSEKILIFCLKQPCVALALLGHKLTESCNYREKRAQFSKTFNALFSALALVCGL